MLAHDENNDNGFAAAMQVLEEGIDLNPCTELYLRRGMLKLESFRAEHKQEGIEVRISGSQLV